MSYRTEFITVTVKQGMEAEAEAWMRILTERQAECVQTLDRERMHYECIFMSFQNDRMCLSWFTVHGLTGEGLLSSPHPIDKLHLEYWEKCIDSEVPVQRLKHVITFLPEPIRLAFEARDAS
jgi:hypothetical protein